MATNADAIKSALSMGLRLLAFKPVTLEDATADVVDEAMAENGWDSVSAPVASKDDPNTTVRFYYSTAQKVYARATCNGTTGAGEIASVEEADVLELLSFEELQKLGNLIDKKSVAFIRIFSEKERQRDMSAEEREALNARYEKMINEAEVALRKR